ncbi:hypothetical protein DW668_04750 [Bacteroides stercoris]|uniref:Minor tail protein gp31 C-terminal domain-containing protein n=1 Tax=Bacteroides stercoris TaxID=46506 RepID=A0A414Q801_BACSE|nr:hypothetical protein [Bacteroides stercoris]RHF76901.1 hypothetical protein DW668_04750 [Bacteroides stercoris]
MAWTEQDYQEIVARLMASSIGVNEVPNADKADDVTSLPAFKPSGNDSKSSVVNYPLEFLKGEQGEPGIQGEPGKSFKVAGEYATLEALKSAVPDGSAVDGFMAVGTEVPYDYYAWVNGEWISQGKIGGIDEAPTDGKAYGRKNGDWAEVPAKSDVLTKTNSESFTPTGDYQPATKKYVDDKHILLTITNEAHQQLNSNQEVKAGEAESKINLVFGSIDNFKNIIHRLLSDDILFLKITEKEIFKVSTSHTYCNPNNGAYELSFIYTYTSIADANNISLVTKRIFIALNSNATNFFVVKDILVSDNLTTLTKKTAAEYEAIGSKDANTAYCVTD